MTSFTAGVSNRPVGHFARHAKRFSNKSHKNLGVRKKERERLMIEAEDELEPVRRPSYTEEWRGRAYFRKFNCKHENIEDLPGQRHRSCADCGFEFDGSVGEASAESELASADSAVVPGSLKATRKAVYLAQLEDVASIKARDKEEVSRQLALRTKAPESGISPVTVTDGSPLRDFQITVSVDTEIFAAIERCNSLEELGVIIVQAMQAGKKIKGYLLRAYERVKTVMKETGKYSKTGLDKFCREKLGRSRVYFENELSGRAEHQRDQRKRKRAAAQEAKNLRQKPAACELYSPTPSGITEEPAKNTIMTEVASAASDTAAEPSAASNKSRGELVLEAANHVRRLFAELEPAAYNLAIFELSENLHKKRGRP